MLSPRPADRPEPRLGPGENAAALREPLPFRAGRRAEPATGGFTAGERLTVASALTTGESTGPRGGFLRRLFLILLLGLAVVGAGTILHALVPAFAG